jgi:transglycosylase-like protein with SLT domain
MSTNRFGRIQKAVAIVPLALLSAAWTASLAGVGAAPVVVSSPEVEDESLPDGSSVPSEAIEAPASVSDPDEASDGSHGDAERILATSSANGIPASALAAYQRAETVINSADKACNLTWQLVAAIGRVESNHGRFGGNALDDSGVAQPGIYGVALNGTKRTSVIRDTDAGQLDNDTAYDRAVGPMQFIPSTWSVVGVDADNDGQRNPQDIDDAALATAVYLCSGDNDLSTVSGQRASVYRYNHSTSYVNLVLRIMNNYLAGDFSSVPDGTTAAGLLVPEPPAVGTPRTPSPGGNNNNDAGNDSQFEDTPPTSDNDTPSGNDGGDNGGDNGGDGGGNGGDGGADPQPQVNVPPLPSTNVPPVDDVLTEAQAKAKCLADFGVSSVAELLLQGVSLADLNACIAGYTN